MAAKKEVLRKRQIAQALAEKTGAKLKTALATVDFVFDQVAQSMVKGVNVNVKDFGNFKKVQRKARMGRNPATGEMIKIKASTKSRFTASKVLNEAVGGKAKYPVHFDEAALATCCAAKAAPVAKAAAKAPAKAAAKKAPAKKAPAKAAKKVAKKK